MSGLPPFDPERARVLEKIRKHGEDSLTFCDRLHLENRLYVKIRPFPPQELIPPRYVQLSFPGFE